MNKLKYGDLLQCLFYDYANFATGVAKGDIIKFDRYNRCASYLFYDIENQQSFNIANFKKVNKKVKVG